MAHFKDNDTDVIPGIVTIATFSTVWYWNDYYYSKMFIPVTGQETLSVKLDQITTLFTSQQSLYIILRLIPGRNTHYDGKCCFGCMSYNNSAYGNTLCNTSAPVDGKYRKDRTCRIKES